MLLRRVAGPALIAALVAVPVPALAKEAPLARTIADLNDPDRQDALAGALAALGTALLDVKVAPFLKAMDRAGVPARSRDVDPDATLGDLAGPQARAMPRELAEKVPMMMGMMGAMTEQMQVMLPQLEAMGKRMEGAMGNAARRDRAPRN